MERIHPPSHGAGSTMECIPRAPDQSSMGSASRPAPSMDIPSNHHAGQTPSRSRRGGSRASRKGQGSEDRISIRNSNGEIRLSPICRRKSRGITNPSPDERVNRRTAGSTTCKRSDRSGIEGGEPLEAARRRGNREASSQRNGWLRACRWIRVRDRSRMAEDRRARALHPRSFGTKATSGTDIDRRHAREAPEDTRQEESAKGFLHRWDVNQRVAAVRD